MTSKKTNEFSQQLRPFAATVATSMVAIAFVQYSEFRVSKKTAAQLNFAVTVSILGSSFCFSSYFKR